VRKFLRLFASASAVCVAACGRHLVDNEVKPAHSLYPKATNAGNRLADSSSTLIILLKSLERPQSALAGGRVQLAPPGRAPEGGLPKGHETDQAGITEFTGVAPGSYWLRAGSIGYTIILLRIELPVGCRTRIEINLALSGHCDLDPACLPPKPRAQLTTCREP
jgi:hypothetical protein